MPVGLQSGENIFAPGVQGLTAMLQVVLHQRMPQKPICLQFRLNDSVGIESWGHMTYVCLDEAALFQDTYKQVK